MASGHHRKPVTIIEMHQTHPENLPLPVLPPPLHPLYLALSFPPSYNCFLDIVLLSFVWAHCSQQPSRCLSPPLLFVLPALLKLSVTERGLNHILIRGNITSGIYFNVLSVLKCIISDINWDQGRQCFKCTFLMHVPGLIVKDSSLHIIPSSKIVCLKKNKKNNTWSDYFLVCNAHFYHLINSPWIPKVLPNIFS